MRAVNSSVIAWRHWGCLRAERTFVGSEIGVWIAMCNKKLELKYLVLGFLVRVGNEGDIAVEMILGTTVGDEACSDGKYEFDWDIREVGRLNGEGIEFWGVIIGELGFEEIACWLILGLGRVNWMDFSNPCKIMGIWVIWSEFGGVLKAKFHWVDLVGIEFDCWIMGMEAGNQELISYDLKELLVRDI